MSDITLFMFKTADANVQDINNYDVSREGIGRAAEIPDQIAHLYHLVYQAIAPTLYTDQRKAAAILCLTLNAKHLIVGINSLYRLYVSQMFREARSASESTAIANLILHDAKAYAVFANDRVNNETARARARNLFKSRKIFSGVNPYLLKLQDHYNSASERVHTNLMSSMRHVTNMPEVDESGFSLIEIMPQDANIGVNSYLHWSCLVHMDIIDTVPRFIFPEFDAEQPEFRTVQQTIDELMDALENAYSGWYGTARISGYPNKASATPDLTGRLGRGARRRPFPRSHCSSLAPIPSETFPLATLSLSLFCSDYPSFG